MDLKVPHIKLLDELTQQIPIIIDQLQIKISYTHKLYNTT